LLQRWRSRRCAGEALLRIDEAIPFVGSALAGTTKLLGGSGSGQGAGDGAKP